MNDRQRHPRSLTVRFTPAEAATIRLTAQRLGLSYSDLVRAAVISLAYTVEQRGVITWPPPRTATGH